jgi:hypothetical protein
LQILDKEKKVTPMTRFNINKLRKIILMLMLSLPVLVHATGMTVESLAKQGIKPMKTEEIKKLVVGNIIVVRNTETLDNYAARFAKSGKRILSRVVAQKDGPQLVYKPIGDQKNANIADYEIKNNRLITHFDNKRFEVLIFKLKSKYLAARSTDQGAVNWELVLVTQ